ncbi:MAG TPA: DUF1653 domain-containing protein [Candidatus Paceibacterota bacterium]|nr:DUF1653 domain-containing protein [Candidatus Paceibacterota bacterium]
MPIKNVPEKGFYYHYKHDDGKDVCNYSYEVMGTALHTEDRTYTVIYRPLYVNRFLDGADFCSRPYDMFMGDVDLGNGPVPRFRKIEDPNAIARLKEISKEMYGA